MKKPSSFRQTVCLKSAHLGANLRTVNFHLFGRFTLGQLLWDNRILPIDKTMIPITLARLNLSISKPTMNEPNTPAKHILHIIIPIFKFTSPSSALPRVFRAIR